MYVCDGVCMTGRGIKILLATDGWTVESNLDAQMMQNK
jgi:hypothetical protein